MSDSNTSNIPIEDLCIGMYVYLDLNWMEHPFAKNHFLIQTEQQLTTLKQLNIKHVNVKTSTIPNKEIETNISYIEPILVKDIKLKEVSKQIKSLSQCEKSFNETLKKIKHASSLLKNPSEKCLIVISEIVSSLVNIVFEPGHTYLRLLGDVSGDRSSLHGLNTAILSLMLGKAYGLDDKALISLGTGSLLHDLGKIELPSRVQFIGNHFTIPEKKYYQEHVKKGVELATKINLDQKVITIIQQHHEYLDGTGFPNKLSGENILIESRIVSIVDRYDNLCNPAYLSLVMTPHEAIRIMFSQEKNKFDNTLLTLFVKIMGIYPPGSFVQLTNDNYALVMSVNSATILKPNVVIYNPEVKMSDALIVPLDTLNDVGIRRSLKPQQLPEHIINYFSNRTRICYFFERPQFIDGDM